MRNPARTLQTSIFEPLFSQEEKLLPQINQPIHYSPSDWPTHSLSSPFSSPASNKVFCNNMRRAPATIFNDHISEEVNTNTASDGAHERDRDCESITCDGLHSSSGSTSTISTTSQGRPSRSQSSSNVDDYDDGSIASKLLASITKSISTPSLLACCKESARETPYQKALKLRRMKLQHCAEELGSESSDSGSSSWNGENSIFDSLKIMSSSDSYTQFPTSEIHQKSEGNASSMMISVRSSPNLRCTSLGTKHTTHTKERFFPPPLTHTLPKSASSESFSYSLRAYREDGRFVLKEVKVPCRQYLQANRKDGRLTLQLFTPVEDSESKQHEETSYGCQYSRDLQEDENVELCQGAVGVAPGIAEEVGCSRHCEKLEVESANTANLVGELEVRRLKESKEIEHVGIDKFDENIVTLATPNLEKVGCLSAKSLLVAAFNGDCGGKDVISQAAMRSSDFTTALWKCKAAKESHAYMSSTCLSSSSSTQQALLHPPGKSPQLKLSHDFDVTSISQCDQNLVLQSNSTRGISNGAGGKRSFQRFEIASASLQESGYGVGKSTSSTIIFKEVSAKCLMEEMTKLVSSFGLDGGKWCGEKMLQTRELDRSSSEIGGVIKSSMYDGTLKSINIGVKEIDNGSLKANGVHLDVECERDLPSGALKDSNHSYVSRSLHNSSLHFNVQIPSSAYIQAALQGNGWLHTLHCKEVFDRNQLATGFMKLHCVAIRS